MRKLFFMIALAACMSAQANDGLNLLPDQEKGNTEKCDNDSVYKPHRISPVVAFGVGIASGLPEDLGFAPMRSWEFMFGIMYDYMPKGKLQTYSAGFGVTLRNFGMHSGQMLLKGGQIQRFSSDMTDTRSSIRVVSGSFPFLFTQRFGHNSDVRFTVGPIFNINGAKINNNYSIGDDDYNVTTNNIGTRPVTIDFIGALTFKWFGIYCKYSPMSVLKSSSGMEFKSVSVGVCF